MVDRGIGYVVADYTDEEVSKALVQSIITCDFERVDCIFRFPVSGGGSEGRRVRVQITVESLDDE